jgi:hypothetical protein
MVRKMTRATSGSRTRVLRHTCWLHVLIGVLGSCSRGLSLTAVAPHHSARIALCSSGFALGAPTLPIATQYNTWIIAATYVPTHLRLGSVPMDAQIITAVLWIIKAVNGMF